MERDKAKGYLNIAHKGGYLIIGSDKLDGYDKKLYLTLLDSAVGKTGEKIATQAIETMRNTIENLFGTLSRADEEALTKSLKTINGILTKMELENA